MSDSTMDKADALAAEHAEKLRRFAKRADVPMQVSFSIFGHLYECVIRCYPSGWASDLVRVQPAVAATKIRVRIKE